MKALKRTLTLTIVLTLGFGLTACKSEVDDKPAAKVVDTKKGEQTAKKADAKADDAKKADEGAAKKGDEMLAVDPASSTLDVVGAKIVGDHTISFKKFDGKLGVKGGKADSIEFTVQMADFDNEMKEGDENKAKLNGHLASKDFFNVAEFPTATFKSSSITEGDSAAGTHTVKGDLTLRGKTLTVEFPASITMDDKGAVGKAQFTVDRQKFDIKYPGKPDNLIKDEVLLKLNFAFPRK